MSWTLPFQSIRYTITTELVHWKSALLRSTSSPVSQYSFLQNVPYLAESSNHSLILKKEPKLVIEIRNTIEKSELNRENDDDLSDNENATVSIIRTLQMLSQDTINIILEFLDCKSLLNVSCISTWYYHTVHEEKFWAKWLSIEKSRILYLKENTQLNSLSHLDMDHQSTELKLLNAFYKPSSQEEVYDRFQNFSIVHQDSIQTLTDEASMIIEDEGEDMDGFSVNEIATQEQINQFYISNDDNMTTISEDFSPIHSHVEKIMEEQDKYGSYITFRKLKLRNPFIRSKLIRFYTHELKERYGMLTKWINYGKLFASIFFLVGTIFLSLQLDRLVSWWWGFVFFPLLVSTIISSFLMVILWLPTLQWPISLYRWVGKDYVGCWTSWAYTLTIRARWIQLLCGLWMAFTVFVAFAHITMPTIIPVWIIFAWMGIGALMWGITPTQIIVKEFRSNYGLILFIISQCFFYFNVMTVLKLAFLDIFTQNLEYLEFFWIFSFIPLLIGFTTLLVFIMKMSWGFYKMGHSRIPCGCMLWNIEYLIMHTLIMTFIVMLWLRLEFGGSKLLPSHVNSIFNQLKYFFIFIPLELLELIFVIYYILRCFTKVVTHNAQKYPFLLLGGKVINSSRNHKYEHYIV